MEHVPIKGTITVSGIGSVSIEPDTARLNLGVLATHESSTEAHNLVSAGMSSLLELLAESGVGEKDIRTTNVDVRPIAEYDRDHNYAGVSGYEVSSTLAVIVRDLDSVGTLLESALANGATMVHGVDFYVDDPTAAASEARTLAVQHARTSADQLANAAGLHVTGVHSITELHSPPPGARQFDGVGLRLMSTGANSSMPISTGETDISVQIQVVFEIAPIGE